VSVQNIRTRFAIVKRAEKLLKTVDDFFEDAADFGLSVDEADPRGELVAIRKGIIAMLENERRLGLVKLDEVSGVKSR
jgi:hypothetical protein